jgi:hypothetical protein
MYSTIKARYSKKQFQIKPLPKERTISSKPNDIIKHDRQKDL